MELESGWVPESQAIYKSFLKRKDAGELVQMVQTHDIKKLTREGRLVFATSGLEDPNKMYNSVLFYDEKEKKAIGLCQFGPYAQGPVGYVHGGAIATMADIITSHICVYQLDEICVTKYLTINYRRGIPLNCPVLLEVWCVKTDERKVWIDYKMMNAKDKTVYADGESLWLHLKSVL
ncbi:acyl-coenzyme A thioesterase THEM4-like isoform X2 [Amphiura filiformis]